MSLGNDLKKETEKWTERIGKEMKSIKLSDPSDVKQKRFLENIEAYIKDSRHFTEKGDLIRSFEAIIWSWANLELGLEFGVLERVPTTNRESHI